jgi:carbamoyl-phosphate synthase large subunit
VIGLDSNLVRAPASVFCDDAIHVPEGRDPDFGRAILDLVARKGVRLLVPLMDPVLQAIAQIRSDVQRLGCLPAYSGPQTMQISVDKMQTYHFLIQNRLRTPQTRLLSEALQARDVPLPFFIKPRAGWASKNVLTTRSWTLPDWVLVRPDQFICQELLQGQEVTVDAFIDADHQPHCVVPRLRLEVRGGEVTKSTVCLDPSIIQQICRLVGALPDGFGVINAQGFIQPDGLVSWTEINARFGGGTPLSIEAGALYADFLVAMAMERKPAYPDAIRDGLTMLRFDDAIYVDAKGHASRGTDIQVPSWRAPDQSVPSQDASRALRPQRQGD